MNKLCQHVRGLTYKLRMMGITHVGSAYLHGDNQSVLANTTVPESTLKKKSSSLACHIVREGIAIDDRRTDYVNANDNEEDLLSGHS